MSEPIDLTPLLIKRIVRDVLPEDEVGKMTELFDLVPSGPEVEAVEQRESNLRIGACMPVSKYLDVYAAALSHILSRYIVADTWPSRSGDETFIDGYEQQIMSIIRSSLWATTGALLTSDVLRYGGVVYGA